MIQRIQTLYLLLVTILGILLCIFPPVQFLPIDLEGGLHDLNAFDKVPLAIMSVSIPLLAFVNIFFFKRRLLQARLNIVNVILCLGYYALLALYIYYIVHGYEILDHVYMENASYHLNVWTSMHLVNIVLLMMATRKILKDEAFVRAADRLR